MAIAAILGAEEFGFATAPLITMGCVMMRVCQHDTCPMGVATQNPALRARFSGKPEYVESFMRFVARELREIMSDLGVRSVNELVGRTDLLRIKEKPELAGRGLDLGAILTAGYSADREKSTFHSECQYEFGLEHTKDEKLLRKKELKNAIKEGESCILEVALKNTDRTFGTLMGAEITRSHPQGLKEDTVTIHALGAGGQSFGAFIPAGLTICLEGESNDYFGKGLSGGKLIVKAPKDAGYDPHDNIIIGNVALYGATSGQAYVAGMAGERFAIRNSGATAVVEGVGEHGCEYMTGGCVVVLGRCGKNFAAGMSGGVAYVLDEDNKLYRNLNKELVSMETIESKTDHEELKRMIEEHVRYTGSEKGRQILDHFDAYVPLFKKIIPTDYKEMLRLIAKYKEQGADPESAGTEAFREFIGEV